MQSADADVHIGLVGKYINLPDAYLSVVEALKHGGYACGAKVVIDWISADDTEGLLAEGRLHDLDGIVVPGGFGIRGIEGKIAAAGYAREQQDPVPRPVPRPALRGDRVRARRVRPRRRELARSSTRTARIPVIDLMDEQKVDRRHGRHDAARRVPGQARARHAASARSTAKRSCTSGTATATSSTTGTARCSRSTAWCCSGTSPDGLLVEFIELPPEMHPFFVATQAHPEFKSRPNRPHPLFAAFVEAARQRAEGRLPRLPIETEPIGSWADAGVAALPR